MIASVNHDRKQYKDRVYAARRRAHFDQTSNIIHFTNFN